MRRMSSKYPYLRCGAPSGTYLCGPPLNNENTHTRTHSYRHILLPASNAACGAVVVLSCNPQDIKYRHTQTKKKRNIPFFLPCVNFFCFVSLFGGTLFRIPYLLALLSPMID
eukprot:TRINITY_DN16029_c0_g3_i1.p1 TRINITY_DN16029_c0_g3~~TRINITY_DN16029_c0_g3_i1.p1  ORF type:complete len:112 (+),score=4.24 TRINITY_DN16029_c0_g3_i1:423-758(+)